MQKHTVHDSEVEFLPLPGRNHKMIVGPGKAMEAGNMSFGIADFPPNAHAPAHNHAGAEEIIYVLSGHGEIYFDGVPEPVEPGTVAYVPVGVEHSINNQSGEIMRIVYVFSPPVAQGSYERAAQS
ncbi:MAG: cupin domain-containing protein [Armatimonadota bacterium]